MKPNDSSIGELSNDDVYDVFHQTVNKLHGVWNDMLAAKAPKVQDASNSKQGKKGTSDSDSSS